MSSHRLATDLSQPLTDFTNSFKGFYNSNGAASVGWGTATPTDQGWAPAAIYMVQSATAALYYNTGNATTAAWTAVTLETGTSLGLTDISGTDSALAITGLAATAATGGSVDITGGATTTSGVGGAATLTGGAGSGSNVGGAATVTGGLGGSTNAVGGAATITAGAGNGTGNGAIASLVGGASGGGATGAGGVSKIVGGAAASTNGAGGAAQVTGGLGTGTGAGGAVTITSGAAGATGVAGAVNIAVGAATAGAGSAVTITGGNGAGGTAAGGAVNIIPGTAVSTGTPGEFQVNSVAGTTEAMWQQSTVAAVPVSGAHYVILLANRAYRIKAASVCCSSTSTTPTVDIKKDTGTTAPGSGTTVLTGVISFSGTANTVVAGTLVSTVATLTMAAGDRLTITWGGTVGSIVNATVSVLLVPC